jgi:hypothetical protein
MQNQKISKNELDLIRSLGDFDLTMFISEVHDHGWAFAKTLLPMIESSIKKNKETK